MKTIRLWLFLLSLPPLLAACGPPKGEGAASLAQAKSCMGCHAMDRKVVGPAFKDVAVKYAGDLGAQARLAAKIQAGGAGVWGQVPMPANEQVSDAEAAELAAWVLNLK